MYILFFCYLTGCGHCKQMKPGYTQAAAKMKESGVSFLCLLLSIVQCKWHI